MTDKADSDHADLTCKVKWQRQAWSGHSKMCPFCSPLWVIRSRRVAGNRREVGNRGVEKLLGFPISLRLLITRGFLNPTVSHFLVISLYPTASNYPKGFSTPRFPISLRSPSTLQLSSTVRFLSPSGFSFALGFPIYMFLCYTRLRPTCAEKTMWRLYFTVSKPAFFYLLGLRHKWKLN